MENERNSGRHHVSAAWQRSSATSVLTEGYLATPYYMNRSANRSLNLRPFTDHGRTHAKAPQVRESHVRFHVPYDVEQVLSAGKLQFKLLHTVVSCADSV